jgi:hypothetical protein
MMGQPIEPGRVVLSRAGRDAGRLFVVLAMLDENHAAIADGALRKVAAPKKKKIKHLRAKLECFPNLLEKLQNGHLLDADVRSCLDHVRQACKEG